MRRHLLAAALIAAASPVAALDLSQMSEQDRAILREEIRAYLIENPEILVDVANALDAKQSAQQATTDKALVAANSDAIFKDGYSFVGGNPDAAFTIVEFVDYRCGYCRKSHPEIAALVKSDANIRYVVKEFPILGDQSTLAARFAISVLRTAGPEAYAKVNAGFYDGTFRGEVTDGTLAAWAKDLGLDAGKVMAGMADPEVSKIIDANHALAEKLQIGGTPTFVLGDTMIRGYLPLAQMKSIVAAERG
jgi:protein-disulfide isomerase